jgi:alkylation response protein AidB-like acyl-CoA dehydrogenase
MLDSHSPLLDEEGRRSADEVLRFATAELSGGGDLRARDAAGEFWEEGWRLCAARGLCGLPVPRELGGAGANRVTTAAALEALGYGCDDGGLVFALNAHLWSAVIPLWQFGTEAQQERYLGPLARGEWVGSHAMTEPGSGSDAFSLATAATPADGGGYRIDGHKALISNAPAARVFVVFARRPGTEGVMGVTPFLVDADAPGVTVTGPTDKLGLRTTLMGEIALDGVVVGEEAVLGPPGRGARVFTASMEWERLLIMAGQLGSLRRSLEEAAAYARERRQFGAPIGGFQAVSEKLVDARVGLAAARALMYETAWRYDHGEASGPAPAAAVKLLAAETTLRSALDLLQVHGGRGYTSELPFERRLRDAVGARLYSGTSEMMREILARSMGL